jgi:hypothetical protein
MQDTRQYNADFFRAEIERVTLELTQGISNAERVQLQNKLASARDHLAGLENQSKIRESIKGNSY